MATEKKPFSRLPKNVSPTLYDLTLKPDLKAFTFEGTEKISIKVNEATQTIVFNTNEIVIKKDSLVLSYGTDKSIDVEKIETSVENETTTLHFKETLVPGDALLSFTFTGKLCEILVSVCRYLINCFRYSERQDEGLLSLQVPQYRWGKQVCCRYSI